jgi:hypothetical protein
VILETEPPLTVPRETLRTESRAPRKAVLLTPSATGLGTDFGGDTNCTPSTANACQPFGYVAKANADGLTALYAHLPGMHERCPHVVALAIVRASALL